MKKYLLIILSAVLVFCFASCNGNDGHPSGNDPLTDIPEDSADSVFSTATVSRILESVTEEDAVEIFVDDFNSDGEPEAYAVTSSNHLEDGSEYYTDASLWFVKSENAEKLVSGNICPAPSIYDFPDKKLFKIDIYADSEILSNVFFVSGNHAYSYGSFEGRLFRDNDSPSVLYIAKTEQDADYNMTTSEFEATSVKPYYLYFDGNFFCEYGGTELREDQLRAISGADEILTAISEGGYVIDTIYRRDNGIININLSKDKGNGIVGRENVTLFHGEETVRLVPAGNLNDPLARVNDVEAVREILSEKFASPDKFSYSGSYLAAAIPDIAH